VREAFVERKTNETAVKIGVNLDKKGESKIDTGIGFLDHMLELFAFRAGITLNVECRGDLHVDGHHTAEDIGIVLGQAISSALGDKSGINRYGEASVPMDESLANCALDISGRPFLVFNVEFASEKVGELATELVEEFLGALTRGGGITLHINIAYGKNTHHMIEAIFKALGVALKRAVNVTDEGVPSTKGVL